MEASIFKDLINKYLPGLAKKITEKVNGKAEDIVFEHKKYLKKNFSPDMKWSSLGTNTSIVAADVVTLDSELPLKKRGSFSSAEGEIPKLGMKKSLSETALQALKNLKARGQKESQIATKLFQDAADSVKGVYERLDIMFLQALSTGCALINDDNNTGVGVRVDFGVPTGNQFGVAKAWTDSTATPITDLDNVTKNARSKGYILKYMWMDKVTFNAFRANSQVKDAFAGHLKTNSSYIFRINREELMSFVLEEFGLGIIIIDKMVQIEKDGKKNALEPWHQGNVSFTTSTDLGTITYGELAEVDHPVKDVEYSVVDDFILVSLFRTNDPLRENTSVQALVLPVLDNTESIFIMDTNEAMAGEDTQTEGDANYTYKEVSYTKASVVAGINAAREVDKQIPQASISQLDATLAKKIDALSAEGIELFEAELVPSA